MNPSESGADPNTGDPFRFIESETTSNDRESLIAVRNAVGRAVGDYVYLEIGSHLGGTLQPHVLDPSCCHLWSIDPRPEIQPDARGSTWSYPHNSSDRMRTLLRAINPDIDTRLTCIDFDVSDVPPEEIRPRPHLSFVDGEHTDAAVKADAEFCRSVGHPSGSILVFHDAHIVHMGLRSVFAAWRQRGIPFRAYHLPDCLMVVELGLAIHDDESIRELLIDNHEGYLWALTQHAAYRAVALSFPARPYWRIRRALARRFGRPDPMELP